MAQSGAIAGKGLRKSDSIRSQMATIGSSCDPPSQAGTRAAACPAHLVRLLGTQPTDLGHQVSLASRCPLRKQLPSLATPEQL